jgi:hypothetical protein
MARSVSQSPRRARPPASAGSSERFGIGDQPWLADRYGPITGLLVVLPTARARLSLIVALPATTARTNWYVVLQVGRYARVPRRTRFQRLVNSMVSKNALASTTLPSCSLRYQV